MKLIPKAFEERFIKEVANSLYRPTGKSCPNPPYDHAPRLFSKVKHYVGSILKRAE